MSSDGGRDGGIEGITVVPTSPVLREVDPLTDNITVCKLCFRPASADESLGPLYEYTVDLATEVYCAHYFCLLFSSGLKQNGADEEQIKGFLVSDSRAAGRSYSVMALHKLHSLAPTIPSTQPCLMSPTSHQHRCTRVQVSGGLRGVLLKSKAKSGLSRGGCPP